MKKILLTLAVAFSLSALTLESNAQAIPYYSTETMDEINATPEQRIAVKELADKANVLFKELKANKSLSKEEAIAEKRKITSARAAAYWKLLTPEQTKYLREKAKANK